MRLGRGFTAVARQVPRLAGLAGLMPCTPCRALWARSCSRESKLAAELPPFGNGPHGSLKSQRGWKPTLAFCVAKPSKQQRIILASLVEYVRRQPRIEKQACLWTQLNHPSPIETSQAPTFESAQRQLRGSRAAIGSGGKKARPFWRRKKASTSAHKSM